MNSVGEPENPKLNWPSRDFNRVPFEVFVDEGLFDTEQEKIFRGDSWCYVGLAAEVPNPGDFRTTYIGTTPVVLSRGEDGELYCFLNKCAHRGSIVVRESCGNAKAHTCVYHQWMYDSAGALAGAPFRRGIAGKGGYPKDFKLGEHGLRQLRVASQSGLVFATFSETIGSLEDYIDPRMRERIAYLTGRELKILGYQRQSVNGNWKLYIENLKDLYHGGLLHQFNSTFGLFRASHKGNAVLAEDGASSMVTTYFDVAEKGRGVYVPADLSEGKFALEDSTLFDRVQEHEDGMYLTILLVYPSLVLAQVGNNLHTRHIIPKSVDNFDLVWTCFGYADDDAALADRRLRHANLIGPSGVLSMEDGEALELVHRGISGRDGGHAFVEMGGRKRIGDQEHMITEVPIRGFWRHYCKAMGLPVGDGGA